MQTNEMTCDGCGKTMDLKADRLELKALRGGIALNIKRGDALKVMQLPPTVEGVTPTLHFCNGVCLNEFFIGLVQKAEAQIEESKGKK